MRRDEFYALFYLALFAEARGEWIKAEGYLRQAIQTKYAIDSEEMATTGRGRSDYMVTTAKVSKYHRYGRLGKDCCGFVSRVTPQMGIRE